MPVPVHQLLNNSSLPYANKAVVQQKASALLTAVPTLAAKIGRLVLPDGSEYTLLIFHGTIPIKYQGQQYNIPIEIFLPQGYPDGPPKAFVRPTPSMIVKPGHRYVHPDGEILIETLLQWTQDMYRRSSLVDIVQMLIRAFSIDPPLFSVPPNRSTHPGGTSSNYGLNSRNLASTTARNIPPATGKYYCSTLNLSIDGTLVEAKVVGPSGAYQGQSYVQNRSNGYSGESDPKRRELLAEVTERIQMELSKRYSTLANEIEKESDIQSILKHGGNDIESTLQQMQSMQTEIQNASTYIEEVSYFYLF